MPNRETANFKRALRALASVAAATDPRKTATMNFDGSEIKDAHELAATMGITYTEAVLRLETKDLYAGMNPQALIIGLHDGVPAKKRRIVKRGRAVALSKQTPRQAHMKTSRSRT